MHTNSGNIAEYFMIYEIQRDPILENHPFEHNGQFSVL